jgi:hypothetical protein
VVKTGPHREQSGRSSWARRAGSAALVALALASPPAFAAPAPGAEAEGGSRVVESGLLAGLQLTSLMLHLVSGVPSQQAASAPGPALAAPMTLMDLEARVWAGEEGLSPTAPCER